VEVKVVSVGKDRSGLFEPGVQAYAARLAHQLKLSLVELTPSRHQGDRAREEEGDDILRRAGERAVLVALDERGKPLSTRAFAQWLDTQRNLGRPLVFAVGGDEGLSDEVRARAGLVLSLSAMTLPHRLARLVLLEQLYRAMTLLRGEPYHK
jgi:23S rRNA (pseudouridine1915-N3)-methyltransferase